MEILMEKLPVFNKLTDKEYELFLKIYNNHISAMGAKERQKHTLSDIVKVDKDIKNRCFKVYFKNGNWWHYYLNGSWG